MMYRASDVMNIQVELDDGVEAWPKQGDAAPQDIPAPMFEDAVDYLMEF